MSRIYRLLHLPEEDVDANHVKINEYTTIQNIIDIATDKIPVFEETYDTYQSVQEAIRHHDIEILRETLYNGTAMDTAITTLRKNIKYVKNGCLLPYSDGSLEVTIGKIKKLKRNSYGFRNLDHFITRIRLICAKKSTLIEGT
ncbi:transposase [Companilactobacillus halodurans]|uniref:Transposase n=1 Tax=Companilactobacillus halodurans TaxID=2584183 RepID=A0A5P0ZZP5_9LACO|nr:transposase [Companilactobacillus halodurans]MQS76718.1 transposase [Companilactobacillus halodurans]MQS98437.1 transposase [Companilactobacillus halodurans]